VARCAHRGRHKLIVETDLEGFFDNHLVGTPNRTLRAVPADQHLGRTSHRTESRSRLAAGGSAQRERKLSRAANLASRPSNRGGILQGELRDALEPGLDCD
jgi:hypothetical protein